MKGSLIETRLIAVLACILMIPVAISAQDLGSTSGLFSSKPSKSSPKKSRSKKSTPKRSTKKKSTASKRKAPRKTATKTSAQASSSKPVESAASKVSIESAAADNQTKPVSSKSAADSQVQIANNTARKPQADIVITVGKKTSGDFSEMFESAISEGNTARNRRLYTEAEQAYSRAMSINPSDSRAIYGLGNIYSDQQRWEEAETAYRKALAIAPNSPMANIALSYVLTQPVVGSNLGERYNEAEIIAKKAIELDPRNAIGYDQLGIAMELRGIISQETENSYLKAVALDPNFALAHAHLGRLLRKQGRTNESSSAYRKAIKLATDVPTMILVAEVMQSQQRYLDSEQLLREALRRDPRNPTGLYLLGRALTTRKSFDEAESVLIKSVEVSPKSFVSYALLGSLYSQSGDFLRAEQTLMSALNIVSEKEKRRLSQEFEEVGDGFAEVGKSVDAARLYRRAMSLDDSRNSLSIKLAAAQPVK